MDELLTVRQLQELLHVDRVTIYRMLDARQLPGFKVGGRWRFRRDDIENWLTVRRTPASHPEPPPTTDSSMEAAESLLPLTCMKPIEEILAEACGVAVLTVDPAGRPLATTSRPDPFCQCIQSSPEGQRRCADHWRRLAQAPAGEAIPLCHAGLRYLIQRVEYHDQCLAIVLAGQYVHSPQEQSLVENRAPALAEILNVDGAQLRALAQRIYLYSEGEEKRLQSLLIKVAATFAELCEQRAQFMGRLQRIADIATLTAS